MAAAAAADELAAVPRPLQVDRRSGFCPATMSFRSLRPALPLPPEKYPLSFPSFAISLLPSPPPANPAFVDAITGDAVSYPDFLSRVRSLAGALLSGGIVSKGDIAVVLAPASLDIPVLYFALLSIGAVVSGVNHTCTASELAGFVGVSSPAVAFATAATAGKFPRSLRTILIDSTEFKSFMRDQTTSVDAAREIFQSDTAVIQYSSGTTGRAKAVALPHRSFIAQVAGFHALRPGDGAPQTTLLSAPMYHSMGFVFLMRGVALGYTTVVVTTPAHGRNAGLPEILQAAEEWKVTEMTAAPPVIAAMAKTGGLAGLRRVFCGGAPVTTSAARKFAAAFPQAELLMAYGATEAGGISRMIGGDECTRVASAGRLSENVEARIIDPVTGQLLGVGERGELLVRGPATMKGYVGDEGANAAAYDGEGWLRTGDLCCIDGEGFLYVVDRLKDLIKYKGYQVAPAELEHLLLSLPEITDAVVVPYAEEDLGEIPVALVVRKAGSGISGQKIMSFVAKQVSAYKKIRRVVFLESIPRLSATGKLSRRKLSGHLLGHAAGGLARL